jgi:site-specific DNA-methyltransferase (adenine-specific)
MPERSVDCCVTSPPYFGLRDYGVDGQIGLEPTPDEFVAKLVAVFREVRRVLRDDGTLWLNLGDSYAARIRQSGPEHAGELTRSGGAITKMVRALPVGLKEKDLVGIPWRVAFALQADGWYLRQDIIWHKPNPMPESVTDRCTKSHEYVFLLSKSARYYFDSEAMQEPSVYAGKTGNFNGKKKVGRSEQPTGNERSDAPSYLVKDTRNRRSVWTVTTKPYKGAHFATYPPALIEPCILAGSRKGGVVLDPFNGSGTTGEVAILNGRSYVGIELNAAYIKLAETRIDAAVKQSGGLLFQ